MGLTLRPQSILLTVLLLVVTSLANAAVKKDDDNFLSGARVGAAMASSTPIHQRDDTFKVSYTVTLKNYGNPNFANGIDFGFLKTGSKICPGEKQTIVYTLNLTPGIPGTPGPFLSFVTVSGFEDLGIPVLDLSAAGLGPDPKSDDIPIETSLTSTHFNLFPVIGVAKSATARRKLWSLQNRRTEFKVLSIK